MVIMLWRVSAIVSLGWPSATYAAQLWALPQPLDCGSAEGGIATVALHDILTVLCVVLQAAGTCMSVYRTCNLL
jgi:hypothetical protein